MRPSADSSLSRNTSARELSDRDAGRFLGRGERKETGPDPFAELIAALNAAMEFYRRAMIGHQTFEGRREALAQANKLSRTFTTLLEP